MKSRYKTLCSGMAKVILVLGIIGTIAMAVEYGVVQDVSYSMYSGISRSTERNNALTFGILLSGAFTTGIFYVIFSALAEVLEYLEKISRDIKNDNVVETNEELPPL